MLTYLRMFFLVATIILSCVYNSRGQSDFSYSIGGGIMYYSGDLSDSKSLPQLEILRAYGKIDASMLLVDRLDLSLRYMHGSIEGNDALSDKRTNISRNQTFFSPIYEFILMIRVRAFSVRKQRLINPFATAGIGYFWFNPKAKLDGKVYELQPLGTEGQFIPNGGYPAPYKLSSGASAFGLGVFIRLSDQFSIRVEGISQLTMTDYLDDTSNNYPDSSALAATPNGAIAVLFSSRRPGGFPNEGRSRGNPTRNDAIITFGLSVVYTPGQTGGTNAPRPGIIRKIGKGKSGWWGITPH